MNSLFGIPMDTVMVVALSLSGLVVLILAALALTNRVSFKLGVRNIPRRPAQTVLIVVGLMLSTLIITAAFGTGDTMTYSIRQSATQGLGQIDESISRGEGLSSFGGAQEARYIPIAEYAQLKARLADDPRIDGLSANLTEPAPIVDRTSGVGKAGGTVYGFDRDADQVFGPLATPTGKRVTLADLGPGEAYLTQNAESSLKAKPGDTVQFFAQGQPHGYTIRDLITFQGGLGSNQVGMLVPWPRRRRPSAGPTRSAASPYPTPGRGTRRSS